jgi:hypothetical protein
MLAEELHGQRLQTSIAGGEDITAASRVGRVKNAAVATDPQFVGIARGKDDCVNVGVDRVTNEGVGHAVCESSTGSTTAHIAAIDTARPVTARKLGRTSQVDTVDAGGINGYCKIIPALITKEI